MSVSWYARAMVGQRVEFGKLRREVERRACLHDMPEGAKFCPECGRSAKTVKAFEWLDGYTFKGDEGWPDEEYFGGLRLVRCEKYCLIGTCYAVASEEFEPRMAPEIPGDAVITNLKRNLYVALNKHGLYDDSLFGLWVVLEGSP